MTWKFWKFWMFYYKTQAVLASFNFITTRAWLGDVRYCLARRTAIMLYYHSFWLVAEEELNNCKISRHDLLKCNSPALSVYMIFLFWFEVHHYLWKINFQQYMMSSVLTYDKLVLFGMSHFTIVFKVQNCVSESTEFQNFI